MITLDYFHIPGNVPENGEMENKDDDDGLLSHHLYYMQNIATKKISICKCSSATHSPPATLMKSSPDALYTSMYLLPM